MNLTNYMRDAFVTSVMNDVPKTDHEELIREAAMKLALAAMPPKVKAVYKDPLTSGYIETHSFSVRSSQGGYRGQVGVQLPVPREVGESAIKTLTPMVDASIADSVRLDSLRARLRGVAYGVTTRKALADALPEFVKYMPADEPNAIRSLPAIANVVADFVKAGWPKDKAAA